MIDPHALLARLSHDKASVELGTFDLCCLAALHLRAERDALASFDEPSVLDLFEQVCDVVETGAENPRKRATHAVQRLRDQRMLVRVDGAGLARAGEYALTRIAAAIVEHFITDEALTRESLSLLMGTLLSQLAEVKADALRAEAPDAWRERVVAPLRVTVGDLVAGIDRRQRGMDAQQELTQQQIAGLIEHSWLASMDAAEALLESTSATLAELNEVLLRDSPQLLALLQEIHDRADGAGADGAREAAQRVIEHVDRIVAWGGARQRAWSAYYQYVHRYLRDVVRLDPDRALSARLRDQLGGWLKAPLHLVTARAAPVRLLRDVAPRVDRPVVARPRADREPAPEAAPPGAGEVDLDALIQGALARGAASLAEVTDAVLVELPAERRFGAAGRVVPVAGLVAVGGRLAVAKGVFCGEVDPDAGAEEAALAVEGARGGAGASAAGREKTDCAQMFTV